jgi:hypothetical protein
MPRAYLRIDPNIDQTVGDLEGFIRLLCSAARQPERGRFRDRAILERAVGRARVGRMLTRGDVEPLDDGRLYVVGWDEWQEGDHTVSERMRRMRNRRVQRKPTVSRVTPPPSLDSNDVTTDAVAKDQGLVVGATAPEISPPPQAGRRKDRTNPRALGTNPRANGTSPRQEREAQKRATPTLAGNVLAEMAKGLERHDA